MTAKPYEKGEYDPTPMDAVLFLLECANLSKNDVVYDLGCGDGRILVAAAKLYESLCVGIEIDEETVDIAKRNASENGVEKRVNIFELDATKVRIGKWAQVVTVYGMPDLLAKMRPVFSDLEPETRVLSYQHPIPYFRTIEPRVRGEHKVYCYVAADLLVGERPEVPPPEPAKKTSGCANGQCRR